MQGDPVAADDEQREHDHDDRRADKAELLADDGENEIVVLFGQEQELLPALAESQAEQSARTDGEQALPDLIALIAHPLLVERVEPDVNSARVVGDDAGRKGVDHQQHQRKAETDPVVADTADVHHHRADTEQQHHTGKVRLLRHQRRNHAEDSGIRYDTFTKCGHFVFFL